MQIAHGKIAQKRRYGFLDRAIPDAMAYYQFLNLDYDEKLLDAVNGVSYKKYLS